MYNLLKSTAQPRLPVGQFMSRVSESDPNVEANLSTIFQQICGTKQFWYLRASDLKCMLRECGPPRRHWQPDQSGRAGVDDERGPGSCLSAGEVAPPSSREARDWCMSVHRFETPAHVSHWCRRNGQVIPHRGYKINGCRDLAWEDGWPHLRCEGAHRSGRFQCQWCDNPLPTAAAD